MKTPQFMPMSFSVLFLFVWLNTNVVFHLIMLAVINLIMFGEILKFPAKFNVELFNILLKVLAHYT